MKFLRPILCYVVGNVFFRWDVYDAELILADTIANPMKCHIDALLRFCLMVSLASPIAEVLSHKIVVNGGYLMSVKMVRSPAACCPRIEQRIQFGLSLG